MNEPEWTDFRFFLEVARTGKVSSAGERPGVEHSTVSRRINRLEQSLGSVLFDRRRNGFYLTDAGKALVPHAERMENALLGALEEHMSQSTVVYGTVRVGTPEAFGIHVLAPSIVELNAQQPDLHVELMAQPQFPSLVTREVQNATYPSGLGFHPRRCHKVSPITARIGPTTTVYGTNSTKQHAKR
ncbi:LysR family transcriptional regulator [Paraburkholderia phytofirmans]|uniref:LysR family transcriptional regulator n=1 Tax=Paraburkholderia phytofirmans TaxID=261302 RepID=UPI0009EF1C65|nr:LysR family transcriptional regulator [Paraburkholderia phytofirmans]